MVFKIRIIEAPAPEEIFALGETPGKKLIRHRTPRKGKNGMDKGKIQQMLRKYVGVCAFIVVGVGLLFDALLALDAYAEDEVVVYSRRTTHQTDVRCLYCSDWYQSALFHRSEAELFERLKAEGANTPADVLMTVDVGNLWLAEQADLLQKL